MKKHGREINRHQISYDPEVVVMVFKGEHKIATLMQWYDKKTCSTGFIQVIDDFKSKVLRGEIKLVEL